MVVEFRSWRKNNPTISTNELSTLNTIATIKLKEPSNTRIGLNLASKESQTEAAANDAIVTPSGIIVKDHKRIVNFGREVWSRDGIACISTSKYCAHSPASATPLL